MTTQPSQNTQPAGAAQASTTQASGTPPPGEPTLRAIAMPADTNPSGDIFGGWLMAQMDLAAGNAASRLAQGRCATVAVETMTFLSPVKVGDEITVWANLVKRGRTSMTFDVHAWSRPRDGEARRCVTRAMFTFVALDAGGKPRPLPDGGGIAC